MEAVWIILMIISIFAMAAVGYMLITYLIAWLFGMDSVDFKTGGVVMSKSTKHLPDKKSADELKELLNSYHIKKYKRIVYDNTIPRLSAMGKYKTEDIKRLCDFKLYSSFSEEVRKNRLRILINLRMNQVLSFEEYVLLKNPEDKSSGLRKHVDPYDNQIKKLTEEW